MITRNYCATRQRWRRMGELPKQWVNKKIETCSMYFLIHMLTPGSIACCSVIYCFTYDEDDGAWNCCHPQAFGIILKRQPTQSKLNSRGCQEHSSTDWINWEEEAKDGQIYFQADSDPSITCHAESRKACVSTQGQSELVCCPYCNCTGSSYIYF